MPGREGACSAISSAWSMFRDGSRALYRGIAQLAQGGNEWLLVKDST